MNDKTHSNSHVEQFTTALIALQEDLRQVLSLFCATLKNPKNPIGSYQKLAALEQLLGLLSFAASTGGFKNINNITVTKEFPTVHIKAQGKQQTLLHLREQDGKLTADTTTPMKADVTVTADEELLTMIVSGQPLLYHAFLSGKIQIQGKALKLIEATAGLHFQEEK